MSQFRATLSAAYGAGHPGGARPANRALVYPIDLCIPGVRSLRLVAVAAKVGHDTAVEATPDAREGGARHVDFRAARRFVRTYRAPDGAVDDVHACLARDDANA